MHYLGIEHLDFRHENNSTTVLAINRGNTVNLLHLYNYHINY